MRYGEMDLAVLCAAVLHDVVEDCGVSHGELRQEFGKRVAGIVDEVSKKSDGSFPLRSRDGFVVKMADRLSNLNDVCSCSPEKIERTIDKTNRLIWKHGGAMEAANPALFKRLQDAVSRLEFTYLKKAGV